MNPLTDLSQLSLNGYIMQLVRIISQLVAGRGGGALQLEMIKIYKFKYDNPTMMNL